MIVESIILAIFVFSLGGVILILIKKAPTLNTLPKSGSMGLKERKIVSEAKNKIKNFLAIFLNRIILHKFLSWSKCQIIKIENFLDEVLHKIRKKAKEEKLNGKK